MNDRISIIATLAQAVQLLVKNRKELCRVAFVFVVAEFLFIARFRLSEPVAGASGGHPAIASQPSTAGTWLGALALLYLFAVFAVGWHRTILLGEDRADGPLGIRFGKRESRYFGLIWLCFVGILGSTVLFIIADRMIAAGLGTGANGILVLSRIASVIALWYVLGRLGLAFAALSIDRRFGLGESWNTTTGNGLRLLATYFLALVVGAMGLWGLIWLGRNYGFGRYAPYFMLLLLAVLITAVLALMITINAIVFGRQTGWKVSL